MNGHNLIVESVTYKIMKVSERVTWNPGATSTPVAPFPLGFQSSRNMHPLESPKIKNVCKSKIDMGSSKHKSYAKSKRHRVLECSSSEDEFVPESNESQSLKIKIGQTMSNKKMAKEAPLKELESNGQQVDKINDLNKIGNKTTKKRLQTRNVNVQKKNVDDPVNKRKKAVDKVQKISISTKLGPKTGHKLAHTVQSVLEIDNTSLSTNVNKNIDCKSEVSTSNSEKENRIQLNNAKQETVTTKRKPTEESCENVLDKNDINGDIEQNNSQKNSNRLSTTHQLFSESQEQELIESLDLNSMDEDMQEEPPVNCHFDNPSSRKSLARKRNVTLPKLNMPESNNVSKIDVACSSNKGRDGRPKRVRRTPKEFWLPKDMNDSQSSIGSVRSPEKKRVKKQEKKINTKEVQTPAENKKISNTKTEKNDADIFLASDAFKYINDLPAVQACGFSTATCHSLPLIKCGFLKVESNREVRKITKAGNNFFGGAVIKGQLKIQIGNEEKILERGHSFCIPPLSKWRAVNVGVSDAVVYYWNSQS